MDKSMSYKTTAGILLLPTKEDSQNHYRGKPTSSKMLGFFQELQYSIYEYSYLHILSMGSKSSSLIRAIYDARPDKV